jgi:hypothetical protein
MSNATKNMVKLGAPEGLAVPAPLVTPVMLLLRYAMNYLVINLFLP